MSAPAPAPTLDTLLSRVYQHYPRAIDTDDARHETSQETRRLACTHEAAAIACGKQFLSVPDDERVAIAPDVQTVVSALRAWGKFGERCQEAFPDCVVWDESGPFFDPGYRYSVAEPGWVPPAKMPPVTSDPVVCALSVLAPVYAIYTYVRVPVTETQVRYADFPDRYHDRIDKLCALAEELFGFARLGEDILRHPVPDVKPFSSNRPMNQTTLMDCLFSTYP